MDSLNPNNPMQLAASERRESFIPSMDQCKLIKYQTVAQQKGGILISTNITNKKLKWQCNEGHVFWLTTNKVHRKGQWCKTCGSSIGEREIRLILREYGVVFTQEYVLPMIPYRRYDFYFCYNNRHYLIEFDGEQHFSYVRKYHKTKANFIEGQLIDRVKTYAAWNSGMTIIRIDYTQRDNIRHHIITAVHSPNLVYLSSPAMYTYISNINITQEELQQHIKT